MTFLDKLLDGEVVEWKALGEVCDFKNGFAFKSRLFKETGLPIIRITNVNGKTIDLSNAKYFDPKDYKENTESYAVNYGDILVAMSGATTGKIGFYDYNYTGYLNQRVGKFLPTKGVLDNRYLYHCLLLQVDKIHTLAGCGTQQNLSSNVLKEKIKIPIPCPNNPKKSLAIQAEIVRILDKFTALTNTITDGLPREIALRKQQYEYYRDTLLIFDRRDVEWKALGDVAKVQRGASPRPIVKYMTDDKNGVPWIRISDTLLGCKYIYKTAKKVTKEGAIKSRMLKKGDFIISNSMSFGRPYILSIDGAIHDGWATINGFEEHLNSHYLYYYLSSNLVQKYWAGKINSGSVSNLNADIIKTLQIPIPPLSEQARIVSILDKFDALTNTITDGLPREIALRKQQYEYYRDLLLNFPKPAD